MSQVISLGHRLDRSEIYGPGLRAVFWTQGCNLACKGCWNTQYWSKKGGNTILVSRLLEELDSINGIEGITLLGGEPLQQAEASLQLIKGCKEKGLTVFLYTGYEPNEFDANMQQCFDLCDIAVTGRFVQELRDTTLRWRGSRNQQVHFISNAYDDSVLKEQTEVECHILPNGEIRMVGYAEPGLSSLLVGDFYGG
ncbi:radical SAM protein [Candidatus Poseidonia alphae]|nr:radical SAM protein [Candidatus Poseidonia alphae]